MKSRIALVTGAASGIGRATAELLAEQGGRVVAVDIDSGPHEAARGVSFVAADVADARDCAAAVAEAVRRHGAVDVLVNCAGLMRRATVLDTSEADWDRLMDVNVKSVYLLAREVIPLMAERGGGAIVSIASGWGLAAGPRAAAYCASKGALIQLSRAMAIDHAADNIRVNCVCPGDVDTAMLAQEAAELGEPLEAFRRQSAARPAGRVGEPGEIARAALFLAGDDARYITGAALVVDGGGLLA